MVVIGTLNVILIGAGVVVVVVDVEDVVVVLWVVVVVVVINKPNSANRLRWKSFWDSTERKRK